MELKIDPEFQSLVPPLSQEEYQQLEASIVADGCIDPLVVCNGVIVDGHNRYAICNKHVIEFNVLEKQFESKDDVKVWIIDNQFGRRNISLFQRGELVLKKKEIVAKKAKENMKTVETKAA